MASVGDDVQLGASENLVQRLCRGRIDGAVAIPPEKQRRSRCDERKRGLKSSHLAVPAVHDLENVRDGSGDAQTLGITFETAMGNALRAAYIRPRAKRCSALGRCGTRCAKQRPGALL